MEEISIICLLPSEVNEYCLELRQKIANQFGIKMKHRIPAHITLKYGFPAEDINEIEKVIDEFCLSHPKTKWELCNFGYFANSEKHVVFIDSIPKEDTRKIHAEFMNNLSKIKWVKWGPFDSAELHYHVTLASKGITASNFDEVWSYLNRLEKPNFEIYFDNLAILRIEKDPPFVYNKFRFPKSGIANPRST